MAEGRLAGRAGEAPWGMKDASTARLGLGTAGDALKGMGCGQRAGTGQGA